MIISPMATGNGAFIVHKNIERKIKDYKVISYNPYLTLLPVSLYGVGRFIKADLVHTTPDYGLFHRRLKTPMVLTFHNYVLDVFMRKYSNYVQKLHYKTDLKWFIYQSIKNSSSITAVSHFTANLIAKELDLKREIRVIYNGIDHNYFKPEQRSNRASKEIKVLFCGNLTIRKGIQWLLPIIKALSPGIKIFYTSGLRHPNKLPENDCLQCLGQIRHDEMPVVYNSMDLLLFPTVREGLSLAAIEAMACGLPVVTTDCSSMPELIDDEKGGFLCPLGDVKIFSDKINQLADEVRLRREMGEYNRFKVETMFTLEHMIKQYQELFSEVKDTSKV